MKPVFIKTTATALVAAGMLLAGLAAAVGQEAGAPAPLGSDTGAKTGAVAATVNGEPIYEVEVETPFQAFLKAGRIGKEDPRWVRAKLLSQLVDRRIGAQVLVADKSLYNDDEVQKQMQAARDAAQRQGKSIEQLAAAQGIPPERLREDIIFRIALERYMQRQMSAKLPEIVNRYKSEFDGTEIRASHIMLRPTGYPESPAALVERAKGIREEIEAGKISFPEAAQKYSVAPSREHGGDIGYIPRRGAMLEPFAAALFQLKPGEISEPVATPLGLHLIQATEVKPGTKDIKESMQQIQQLATVEIFKQLVDQHRDQAKVEYKEGVPHFKPGSEVLATP